MQIRNHTSSNGDTFTVLCNTEVLVNSSTRLIFGSKTIIDDILLWCSHTDALLLLMECVCKVFRKYRVSFRLKKCDFLKDRVEYVGHDITNEGNCPAQSKFNLINDWQLPSTGQTLLSFIGLINFYHRLRSQNIGWATFIEVLGIFCMHCAVEYC